MSLARRIPAGFVLALYPLFPLALLVEPRFLVQRLLISGEFESSLDYASWFALSTHSWNPAFNAGLANYALQWERDFPTFYLYSPAVHWLFIGAATMLERVFASPLAVYLYLAWFAFAVAAYLLTRVLVDASSGWRLLLAFSAAAPYWFNPYLLTLLTASMSYLSNALVPIVLALVYLVAQRRAAGVPWPRCKVAIIALALALWLLASLGINYYPFAAIGLVILAVTQSLLAPNWRRVASVYIVVAGLLAVVFLVGDAHLWVPRVLFPEAQVFGELVYPHPLPHPVDEVLTLGFTAADSPRLTLGPAILELRWLTPLLAGAGLLLSRRRAALALFALALMGVMLGKGTSPPWPELNQWLHENVPLASKLQSTDRYWSFVLAAYACGLSACGWWLARRAVRLPRPAPQALALVVALVPIGLSAEYMTGDIQGKLYSADLPAAYHQVAAQLALDTPAGTGRFLYAPWSFDQQLVSDFAWAPAGRYGTSLMSPVDSLQPWPADAVNAGRFEQDAASSLSWYMLYHGFLNPDLFGLLAQKFAVQDVVLDPLARRPESVDTPNDFNRIDQVLVRETVLDARPDFSPAPAGAQSLRLYRAQQSAQRFVFGQPVYVYGEMNAIEAIAVARPALARRPLVWLDQNPFLRAPPVGGADLVVVNAGPDDLTSAAVSSRYRVDLESLVHFYPNPVTDWRVLRLFHTGLAELNGVALPRIPIGGLPTGALQVPIGVSSGGSYRVLLHVLRNQPNDTYWPTSPPLDVLWDGQPLLHVDLDRVPTYVGFTWEQVPVQTAAGRHTLTLRNAGSDGWAVVDDLAVVPEAEFESAAQTTQATLLNNAALALLTPSYQATSAGVRTDSALRAMGFAPVSADGSALTLRRADFPPAATDETPAAVVTAERISAAEYRVHLQTARPGVLVFREAYSPYWDAGGRRPLQTDYYANGYDFDPGTYDFTLRHLPDAAYRAGLIITAGGLTGLLCLLLLVLLRR